MELTGNSCAEDLVGYDRFLTASGAYKHHRVPMLLPGDWGQGKNCTLFMFNNTPGDADDNTDPANQPGEHWLAIWTHHTSCEVFDSYWLPLSTYKNPTLQAWLKQWKDIIRSNHPLQAMDSFTCGHYALFFLKARVRHLSFQDFLAQWHSTNLVLNDRRVGEQLQRLIKTELTEYQQSNVNRSSFDYFYQLVYQ